MELWVVLGAVFVAAIIVGVMQADAKKKKRVTLESAFDSQDGLMATHRFAGEDCKTAIAVDESARKVCLLKSPDQMDVYAYEDVLSCEVFEDGESVTKTVRSSQALGAILGGIAFGGVGALVGGLSGAKKSQGKVRRIDIRIVVNDMKSPIHDVCFLDTETPKNGSLYTAASERARFWSGLLSVAMKQGTEGSSSPGTEAVRPSASDEIRALAKLRDDGLLTDEEFSAQKAKVLS